VENSVERLHQRSMKAQGKCSGLKVSIGAGDVKIEGFLRVDIDESTQPDFLMDAQKLSFKPKEVEVIYASHVLEHFNFEAKENKSVRWSSLVTLLAVWRECLTPEGCLYVCVPNLEQLAKILIEFEKDEDIQKTVLDAIYGGGRNSFDIHYSGFTQSVLTSLLKEAGFREVKTFDTFVNDESAHKIAGKPISLNLVAYNDSDDHRPIVPLLAPEQTETELQKYMRVAEERRLEILTLTEGVANLRKETAVLMHACQERLELIEKINPELAKYRKYYEDDLKRGFKSRVKRMIKGAQKID
jgi:hypothetical protein